MPQPSSSRTSASKPYKRILTDHIDTLSRFIQYQQIRLAQNSTGQQHPLQFAARQLLHGAITQVCNAGAGFNAASRSRSWHRCRPATKSGPPSAASTHQCAAAAAYTRCAGRADGHVAAAGRHQTQGNTSETRFAGAIRTNEGSNAPRHQRKIDPVENGLAIPLKRRSG
jgi:hypothetical protein